MLGGLTASKVPRFRASSDRSGYGGRPLWQDSTLRKYCWVAGLQYFFIFVGSQAQAFQNSWYRREPVQNLRFEPIAAKKRSIVRSFGVSALNALQQGGPKTDR